MVVHAQGTSVEGGGPGVFHSSSSKSRATGRGSWPLKHRAKEKTHWSAPSKPKVCKEAWHLQMEIWSIESFC
ncbi:hypothetical protein GOP47_0006262 [Adiantum capillus-veneris]|uniref:Uncharacterized protein n=1 Tax=Adiantum capillus-veneris TaxID=13818 RepID=A0A9D4V388_ADICA|nr:hypothetical protein GOP47_0006262 [Adiantum capillus-veneris]